MKRVVWLASWFPNRVEPYLGDFIERHALCASRYTSIFVICAIKDASLGFRFKKETRQYSDTLCATIYYYPRIAFLGKGIERIFSLLCAMLLPFLSFIKYYFKQGKPACVHVLVSWKAGLAMLLIRYFFKTPYAVFERWTVFVPAANPHVDDFSRLENFLIRRIFRHCAWINTTTLFFAEVLKQRYPKPVFVIPNAIVPQLFYYKPKPAGRPFRFIHASTLNYQKNVEGMLKAFALLLEEGFDCELVVYGPDQSWIYGDLKKIRFCGEVPHEQIAVAMQASDALILFSRYETFGNVVVEAQACGLPVITSDHPVFDETVEEGINGLKATNEDVADLAAKMKELMQQYERFDRPQIAATAFAKYNPERIGRLFAAFYNQI